MNKLFLSRPTAQRSPRNELVVEAEGDANRDVHRRDLLHSAPFTPAAAAAAAAAAAV
jgi:hypothetical protein